MSLITLVILLILIGVGLWLVGKIPMDGTILLIIRVVGIIVAILLVLAAFGVLGELRGVQVPQV